MRPNWYLHVVLACVIALLCAASCGKRGRLFAWTSSPDRPAEIVPGASAEGESPDDDEGAPCADGGFDLFGAPNPLFDGENHLAGVVDIGVGHTLRIAAAHTESNRSGHRSRRRITDVTFDDDTVAWRYTVNETDFVLFGARPGTTVMTISSCRSTRQLRVRVHEATSWDVDVSLTMPAAQASGDADASNMPATAALHSNESRDLVIGSDVTVSVSILPLGEDGTRLRGALWASSPALGRLRAYSSDQDPDHMVFTLDRLLPGDEVAFPVGPEPNPPVLRFEVVGRDAARSFALEVGDPPVVAPERMTLLMNPEHEYIEEFGPNVEAFLQWFTPPVRATLIDDRGRSILGFQDELAWSASLRDPREPGEEPTPTDLLEITRELSLVSADPDAPVDGIIGKRVIVEPDQTWEFAWTWGEQTQSITFETEARETP